METAFFDVRLWHIADELRRRWTSANDPKRTSLTPEGVLTGLRTAFAVEEKPRRDDQGLVTCKCVSKNLKIARTRSERVHLITGWWDIGCSMRQLRLRHRQGIEAFPQ